MIARILAFSVHQRWLVALLTLAAAAFGGWSMTKLPIDAVPDITNNQVQINTIAPALSPIDIEKQVTYPLETALAGIPGLEYTRSFSRNGFSQITAVFDDKADIYFARQQVNERLTEAKANLPLGAEPRMGPVSTGLGEIYMWTIHYKPLERDDFRRKRILRLSDSFGILREGRGRGVRRRGAMCFRRCARWPFAASA